MSGSNVLVAHRVNNRLASQLLIQESTFRTRHVITGLDIPPIVSHSASQLSTTCFAYHNGELLGHDLSRKDFLSQRVAGVFEIKDVGADRLFVSLRHFFTIDFVQFILYRSCQILQVL